MKILHLVNTLNSGNGISNVAYELAIAQVQHGHEAAVATWPGSNLWSSALENGVQMFSSDYRSRRPAQLLQMIAQTSKAQREFAPDIVHAHTITPLLVSRALFMRAPIIATVHNEWQKSSILMKWADAAVGVSDAVTNAMIRRGMPRQRIRTVLNGTVGSARKSNSVEPQVLQHPAVLFVGALSHRKGIDILLDAFERLVVDVPGAHLYLVGNNTHLPVTRDGLVEKGLGEAVHLEGLQDPYPYYAAADLFVLPSRSEPGALVLYEAAGMGLPVIGARVGGIADFLEVEGGGETFEPENPESLATLMRACLTEPGYLERLRRQSASAAQQHTVERMYVSYQTLYEELHIT